MKTENEAYISAKDNRNIDMNLKASKTDQIKSRTCTLIVTHACNLNCSYCYEKFKSNKMMSLEVAKRCVEKEVKYSKEHGYNWLQINFLGGEPFMNFSLIRELIEWMELSEFGIGWHAFATTNGTMVKGEIQEWVNRHRKLLLSLSYDGSIEAQKIGRAKSDIDVEFFVKRYPVQCLHMTVTPHNLPFMADGVMFLLKRDAKISATLAYGVEWNNFDSELYLQQLRTVSGFYLARYSHLPGLSVLENPLPRTMSNSGGKKNREIRGDKITYDVTGVEYPHHFFSPIVVGDERSIPLANFNIEKCGGVDDLECQGCPILNFCPTCYGFNYLFRGRTNLRDHTVCRMVYVQYLAACEHQMSLFSYLLNLSGEKLNSVLNERKRRGQILGLSQMDFKRSFEYAKFFRQYLTRRDVETRFIDDNTERR